MPQLSSEDAIKEIREGRMVILVDDEDRENEGDLCMAAEKVTPETINFMAKPGRGLICVALTSERANELGLPLMTDHNTDPLKGLLLGTPPCFPDPHDFHVQVIHGEIQGQTVHRQAPLGSLFW